MINILSACFGVIFLIGFCFCLSIALVRFAVLAVEIALND